MRHRMIEDMYLCLVCYKERSQRNMRVDSTAGQQQIKKIFNVQLCIVLMEWIKRTKIKWLTIHRRHHEYIKFEMDIYASGAAVPTPTDSMSQRNYENYVGLPLLLAKKKLISYNKRTVRESDTWTIFWVCIENLCIKDVQTSYLITYIESYLTRSACV